MSLRSAGCRSFSESLVSSPAALPESKKVYRLEKESTESARTPGSPTMRSWAGKASGAVVAVSCCSR